MRASLYPSTTPSKTLLYEFNYLNNARQGFPDLLKSPHLCEKGISILKIDTSSNNWFLSDDILELGMVLERFSSNFKTINAMCFSMGIMPALLLSKQMKTQKIMAFSPIISIFGDDINDKRLRHFKKNVPDTDIRHLWKVGNSNIEGTLCFDPMVPQDTLQARLIQKYYPKLNLVAMPAGGHPCIHVVKETIGFKALQDLVYNNQFEPSNLRDLHKQSRKHSDLYLKCLKKKLDKTQTDLY